ncbi:MAG: SGNH/GDSL hydrolase family protein [Aeromicrobium sp.]
MSQLRLRFPVPRMWLMVALFCVIVLAPLAVQRVKASAGGPTVAVIGDSITARYNDEPGDASQGWWSVVGRHYGVHVETYAQSGSGFVRPGLECVGDRFGDRLANLKRHPPRIVFVEGGRNDWAMCSGHSLALTTNSQLRIAVDRFLTNLKGAVRPQTLIYVLGPPWGPTNAGQRGRVTAIIKSSAYRHHVHFIDTAGVFPASNVIDGIHPNRAGSVALGERVIDTIGPKLP